ncbi:unnamed protein product [Adineta ricciae]|uniref:Uncharacterized protein n=1 Tax=Adineta ricciae TaxID=249248 RepID=A0A815WLC1_ADIRI|nr:unnamed protein product [Adineta ricciae]CAF1549257.1 unnamed protein product [Adineta ricciae]
MLRIKSGRQEYIPLQRVNISATIQSYGADVCITQIFRNDEQTSIETVYCFPIEEQAAIYSFVARIDDREIISILKEKTRAQQDYNNALQVGHGAYLLEQNDQSQDNFIVNVGAIPSGKECQISIWYVSELDLVENGTKIRFVLPTTIAPRYNPYQGSISSLASTTSTYVQWSPYTIDLRCHVNKFGISQISSPSHPIQVYSNDQNYYIIVFAQQNIQLDHDIILDMQLTTDRSNTFVAVEPGAVMVSFTPTENDFRHLKYQHGRMMNEFIFIIDCSGSMSDNNKIGLARQAISLFLKSLPINSYFNIIRFGSKYKTLFKDTTDLYNEDNAEKAEEYIKKINADLGGTELLNCLQWLESQPPRESRARQIFLLTDGEISNVEEVIDLCRTMATSTRIFSFGLGSSPSRSLVKGLARATNGRYVFIPPNSNVDIYVGEQLQKALQPYIMNIQVKWSLNRLGITSIPTKIPPIYAGERLIIYALVDDKSAQFDLKSSVELTTEQYQLSHIKLFQAANIGNNNMISRLATKALILELQHAKLPSSSLQNRLLEQQSNVSAKDNIQKRIIELSLQYHILSPHTAFVGIEKRLNSNNADMTLREVPIQVSADDHHLDTHFQSMSSRIVSALERRLGMDLNGDSYVGGSGYLDKFERITARDINGDGYVGQFFSNLNPSQYSTQQNSAKSFLRHQLANYVHVPSVQYSTAANTRSTFSDHSEDPQHTYNQDTVRYLIAQQKFDGSWNLDSDSIKQLTGHSLSTFQQLAHNQIIVSAIVIVVLETRFAAFSSLWYGVVLKARERLLHLLGNDSNKLDGLFGEIRQRL